MQKKVIYNEHRTVIERLGIRRESHLVAATLFLRLWRLQLYRFHRGVAKFGIALGSGPRGLGFESRHSDHRETLEL